MQTRILDSFLNTERGQEAESILRSCVHCGFCNATCPTYQLLGDELDGPRGRIYQIKQVLEGKPVTARTREHLDRCLTCRNCETTCPSGVQYGRLLDIGRNLTEESTSRSPWDRAQRWAMLQVFPYPRRFALALQLGAMVRPLLPATLREKMPAISKTAPPAAAAATHNRKVLMLEGCVQPAMAPGINAATRKVLDNLGISVVDAPQAGCCGAMSHHMSAEAQAMAQARQNIDAWWPAIERGAEAIVITASGCGTLLKDYGHLLANDPAYADKAARVAELSRDVSEFLAREDLTRLTDRKDPGQRVAFHPPCTLQHGQQITGVVEDILTRAGFTLAAFDESHLCCGSAGTYSLTQPVISKQLRDRKLGHIKAGNPNIIASANIGCLSHLATGTDIPVKHWIELLVE